MQTEVSAKTSLRSPWIRALVGTLAAAVVPAVAMVPAGAQAGVVTPHAVTPHAVTPHVVTPPTSPPAASSPPESSTPAATGTPDAPSSPPAASTPSVSTSPSASGSPALRSAKGAHSNDKSAQRLNGGTNEGTGPDTTNSDPYLGDHGMGWMGLMSGFLFSDNMLENLINNNFSPLLDWQRSIGKGPGENNTAPGPFDTYPNSSPAPDSNDSSTSSAPGDPGTDDSNESYVAPDASPLDGIAQSAGGGNVDHKQDDDQEAD
jgi:hypothetical protein